MMLNCSFIISISWIVVVVVVVVTLDRFPLNEEHSMPLLLFFQFFHYSLRNLSHTFFLPFFFCFPRFFLQFFPPFFSRSGLRLCCRPYPSVFARAQSIHPSLFLSLRCSVYLSVFRRGRNVALRRGGVAAVFNGLMYNSNLCCVVDIEAYQIENQQTRCVHLQRSFFFILFFFCRKKECLFSFSKSERKKEKMLPSFLKREEGKCRQKRKQKLFFPFVYDDKRSLRKDEEK